MKTKISGQLKEALLTRRESKTIKGGYNLGGGSGCSYACCVIIYYPIPRPPNCTDNRQYYRGTSYSGQVIDCVKCS